jgi:2'-5' RNA ligase
MRPHLFVAVVPPAAVREQLATALQPLRNQHPDLRWEAPPRWHVTLCFLGPVDPTPALLDEIGGVARRTPTFPVRLRGAGCFGEHVLWAGVEGEIARPAEQLAQAAGRAGLGVDERPFVPHLTLVHRRRRGEGLTPLLPAVEPLVDSSWAADALVLLAGGRPDYVTVQRWALDDPPAQDTYQA